MARYWDGVEGGEGSGVVECLECRDSSQGVEGQEVVMGEHSPSQEVSRSSHARDSHGRHQHHGLGHTVSSLTNTTNTWDTRPTLTLKRLILVQWLRGTAVCQVRSHFI